MLPAFTLIHIISRDKSIMYIAG